MTDRDRARALAALETIDRLRNFQLSRNDPRVIAAYKELSAAFDELFGPLPAETIQQRIQH